MFDSTTEIIRRGFDEITPDIFDEIMAREPVCIEEEVFVPKFVPKAASEPSAKSGTKSAFKATPKSKGLIAFAAVAAAFVCVFSGVLYNQNHITETLYLDVNPSISISLNKDGEVVKVDDENDDGAMVIEQAEQELSEADDLSSTVIALLKEIKNEGYFKNDKADVLLSLQYSDEERQKVLDPIAESVNDFMDDENLEAVVILHRFEEEAALEEVANKKHLSLGKHMFLKKLAEANHLSEKAKKKLAEGSIADIETFIESQELKITDEIEIIKNEAGDNSSSTSGSQGSAAAPAAEQASNTPVLPEIPVASETPTTAEVPFYIEQSPASTEPATPAAPQKQDTADTPATAETPGTSGVQGSTEVQVTEPEPAAPTTTSKQETTETPEATADTPELIVDTLVPTADTLEPNCTLDATVVSEPTADTLEPVADTPVVEPTTDTPEPVADTPAVEPAADPPAPAADSPAPLAKVPASGNHSNTVKEEAAEADANDEAGQ
ncbi:MAG: hypothetical protein IJI74_00790 [Firmicutes bacterium]|nr:hypothetical protein [Bacillota bacterium]